MIKEINDTNFDLEISNENSIAIINFGASWDPVGKKMNIIFEEFSKNNCDKAIFGNVDIDSNPELSAKFNIQAVPSILFFKNREMVEKSIGLVPTDLLLEKLVKTLEFQKQAPKEKEFEIYDKIPDGEIKIDARHIIFNDVKKKIVLNQLENVLSKEELTLFEEYEKTYQSFSSEQLDSRYIIAEINFQGKGVVKELIAYSWVNQEGWIAAMDEPDIQIDDVNIPVKVLSPEVPIEINENKTVVVVLDAGTNINDKCKDLPRWIWNEGRFEFMLSFKAITESDNESESSSLMNLITF